MKLHLSKIANQNIFTAHGAGFVAVNGERFENAIVVTPTQIFSDWKAQDFDQLNEADFNYFVTLQADIVLLGTGPRQRFAHPRLYRALTDARIGVEFMDTPAACRTFNILMAEDRKVVAGILFR
ncbi:MAG: Mth938-like domain-containing protein [Pseudomonadota bacterium]